MGFGISATGITCRSMQQQPQYPLVYTMTAAAAPAALQMGTAAAATRALRRRLAVSAAAATAADRSAATPLQRTARSPSQQTHALGTCNDSSANLHACLPAQHLADSCVCWRCSCGTWSSSADIRCETYGTTLHATSHTVDRAFRTTPAKGPKHRNAHLKRPPPKPMPVCDMPGMAPSSSAA
jgi:hypothetical protein